jgi:hypothetical protein
LVSDAGYWVLNSESWISRSAGCGLTVSVSKNLQLARRLGTFRIVVSKRSVGFALIETYWPWHRIGRKAVAEDFRSFRDSANLLLKVIGR